MSNRNIVAFNGIYHGRNQVSGNWLDGYFITCSGGCTARVFLSSAKHLPPEQVENKFRDKGWQVNSNSKHLCPNCIDRRRLPRAPKSGITGAIEKSIIANREIVYANAANARKLITSCGIIPTDVIELEHPKHSKFKFIFRGMPKLSLGRISSAETHLSDGFNAVPISSHIEPHYELKQEGDRVIIEPSMLWYVTLELIKKPIPVLDVSKIAAE